MFLIQIFWSLSIYYLLFVYLFCDVWLPYGKYVNN